MLDDPFLLLGQQTGSFEIRKEKRSQLDDVQAASTCDNKKRERERGKSAVKVENKAPVYP